MQSYFTTDIAKVFTVITLACLSTRQSVTGLQCLECQEVYDPKDCPLSGTCGKDEVCFTRSFSNYRDRRAFRMGCETLDVCDLYNRTSQFLIGKRDVSDAECRQCCSSDNCNYQLCSGLALTTRTTPVTQVLTISSTLPQPTPTVTETIATSTEHVTPSTTARDCKDYLDRGDTSSGVYPVRPEQGDFFNAFCDMTTDGGGWMIIQKRFNGSVSFQRNWNLYKHGFGDLEGEFWLGNEFIHQVTTQPGRLYTLRFDLTTANGTRFYATYSNFTVAGEDDGYRVSFGSYKGNAGDNFSQHRGMKFSTASHDNDDVTQNCAALYRGGWWYHNCYEVNINGVYGLKGDAGLIWYTLTGWTGALKATSMAIRPEMNS